MVSNIIISKSRFQHFNWIKYKYSQLTKKKISVECNSFNANYVISSYIHLFHHCYKKISLDLNKFINVIYSLHLLHTLSINSFEHSFLLEMIHFKCQLFYLFFSNRSVIYIQYIHNTRKFLVLLVIFHTTTTSS